MPADGELLWAVHCIDGPTATASRRADLAAEHSAHLHGSPDVTPLAYGPLLDRDGQPCGSLLLVGAPDQSCVQEFISTDVFSSGGVWASVAIHEFPASANAPVPLQRWLARRNDTGLPRPDAFRTDTPRTDAPNFYITDDQALLSSTEGPA